MRVVIPVGKKHSWHKDRNIFYYFVVLSVFSHINTCFAMEQTAICPKGMVMASALMGEGKDSVFSTRGECREIKRQEAGNDAPPHANTSWNSKL